MSSQAPASEQQPVPLAPRNTFWLVVLLGALAALAPFSIDTYLPAFPAIAKTYNTTVGAVEITLAVYFVGLAFGQLLYGPFADSVGRKPPLYVGLVLFVVASLGCAFAPNIASLTALRFVQALGGCSAMLMSRTVVRDYFSPRQAARIFSFLMLVIGVSPVIAPLVGGWLVVHVSWRATFIFVSALGAVTLLSVMFFLKETLPPSRRRPVALGSTLRLYLSLLRDPTFMVYTLSSGMVMAGFFAYLEGSPLVFIELNHVPAERFGLYFGGIAIGFILSAQVNGFLVHRIHPNTIFRWALVIAAVAGVALFAVTKTAMGGFPALLVLLSIFIWSNGFSSPDGTALALAPHGQIAGSASAVLGCMQFALGGIGGTLVSSFDNGTAMPLASVIAVAAVLALLINLMFAPKIAPHMH